jgi:hypothetical protein
MRYIRATATVLFLVSTLCYAQDASPSDPETIRQLIQQVKELQERVKALESQKTPAGAPTDSSNIPTPPVEPPDQTTPVPTVTQELHELHGIQWRGFGEVDYKVLNQRTPELGTYGFVAGSAGNFYTGDFDLLLTSRINDQASVLSEIVFEEPTNSDLRKPQPKSMANMA